ncbi:hypothetical protein HDU93_004841 [Gonapodya sp. JEL0774]|nr:hypothetical protein HDU93_004841 [Gonapodya sp. JEL0774]
MAAEKFVIRCKWKDEGSHLVHLDDDDDLELLFETLETAVVIIELEEVGLRWEINVLVIQPEWVFGCGRSATTLEVFFGVKVDSRTSRIPMLKIAEKGKGLDTAQLPRVHTLVMLLHLRHLGGLTVFPTDATLAERRGSSSIDRNPHSNSSSIDRYQHSNSKEDGRYPAPLKDRLATIISDHPAFEARPQPQAPRSIIDSNQYLSIKIGSREFSFPLEWQNSKTSSRSDLMGILGKPQWIGQRSWGYKKVGCDEDNMTMTYGARASSIRDKFRKDTEYNFTIMFDGRPMYRAAEENYPAKLETLTPDDFFEGFIKTISEVRDIGNDHLSIATEWACITPPFEAFAENAKVGGKYHCLYLVRDARSAVLTEGGNTRLQNWIKTQMSSGVWGLKVVNLRDGLPATIDSLIHIILQRVPPIARAAGSYVICLHYKDRNSQSCFLEYDRDLVAMWAETGDIIDLVLELTEVTPSTQHFLWSEERIDRFQPTCLAVDHDDKTTPSPPSPGLSQNFVPPEKRDNPSVTGGMWSSDVLINLASKLSSIDVDEHGLYAPFHITDSSWTSKESPNTQSQNQYAGVVLRSEALPETFDEFFYLLSSKMPPIASAAEKYVVRLKYKDQEGSVAVHLDDDDDLLVMYESSETTVINVELEEVTEVTRDRLWTKQRFDEARELAASSARALPARRSPSISSGIASAAPVPDQWPQNVRQAPPISRSNSSTYSDGYPVNAQPIAAAAIPPTHQHYAAPHDMGSLHSRGQIPQMPPPYLSHSSPLLKDVGVVGSIPSSKQIILDGKGYNAFPVTDQAQAIKSETLVVVAAAREYRFPIVWKSADTTTTEELMGPLGRPDWSIQRSWGYKKAKHDESTMTIQFSPRKFSLRSKTGGDTHYVFTIMFDSHPLFTAAVSRYLPKFDALTAAQFRMQLMDPISTSVVTEWACIQPPLAFVTDNSKMGGEYHVLYVVKDASRDMSESTRTRMQSWLKGQMIAGSWAKFGQTRQPQTMSIGPKRLRVEYWDRVKHILLKEGAYPGTLEEFVVLLCSKVEVIENAALQFVLVLKYLDGDGRTIVEMTDDRHLRAMYRSSAETCVVFVDLAEATEWDAPPNHVPPAVEHAGTAVSKELSSDHISSNEHTRTFPDLSTRSLSGSLPRSSGEAVTLVEMRDLSVGARNFALPWRVSAASPTAELMGVLGEEGWGNQRTWGYKQLKPDNTELSVTYVPRYSSVRQKAQTAYTLYTFTILFANHNLYHAALPRLPLKLDRLLSPDFRSYLLDPISNSIPEGTEWAYIAPPGDLVAKSASAQGGLVEYAALHVVKPRGTSVNESCLVRHLMQAVPASRVTILPLDPARAPVPDLVPQLPVIGPLDPVERPPLLRVPAHPFTQHQKIAKETETGIVDGLATERRTYGCSVHQPRGRGRGTLIHEEDDGTRAEGRDRLEVLWAPIGGRA